MKKKQVDWKVGQKIVVYEFGLRYVTRIHTVDYTYKQLGVEAFSQHVHFKQCRNLVKKKKQEPQYEFKAIPQCAEDEEQARVMTDLMNRAYQEKIEEFYHGKHYEKKPVEKRVGKEWWVSFDNAMTCKGVIIPWNPDKHPHEEVRNRKYIKVREVLDEQGEGRK